jgi:hypothetical protein
MTTTTAQEALKAFEDSWVTLQWTTMTDARRNIYLRDHLGLQIAARKEAEANKLEAEQQAEINAQQRKQAIIEHLQSLGYTCDNSQQDWQKLYARPEIFGELWQEKADYQQSISPDIDYFISKAMEIWDEL